MMIPGDYPDRGVDLRATAAWLKSLAANRKTDRSIRAVDNRERDADVRAYLLAADVIETTAASTTPPTYIPFEKTGTTSPGRLRWTDQPAETCGQIIIADQFARYEREIERGELERILRNLNAHQDLAAKIAEALRRADQMAGPL